MTDQKWYVCWELNLWQQQLVRAYSKCYNVTIHFEMGMVNFNFKIGTYMSGTNPMAAIGSKGWWQMLQRYKLFTCEVVTALQA